MTKYSIAFAIALLFLSTSFAQAKSFDQANDQVTSSSGATQATAKKTLKKSVRKLKSKSNKVDAPDRPSFGDSQGLQNTQDPLELKSNVALVIDQENSQVLFEKNSNISLPIASITKLMTSLVVLEANQDMDELLEVTTQDIDTEKGTG